MRDIFKQIDYDKISDDLCLLGFNVVMRFNVSLSKATQEGKRYHFHREYEYETNKYIDTKSLVTIRRQFDYYISIENLRQTEFGAKEFIMIRIQDIMYVREQLQEACRWFRGDSKFENLFASKDNKTILLGNVEPIYVLGLNSDKYLKLEPTVISYNENTSPGIRVYLSSPDNYVDMNVDKFMGIVYLLNSINMYESAQILLNYLQRPEYGTNLYTFDSKKPSDFIDEDAGFMETKSNKSRQIGNKKQKSFFDKINEL